MGPKYVTRQETDIWGNDQTVTRREPTAYDVGSAVGLGLGLMVAARRNAAMKAVMNNAETAQKFLQNGDYERALSSANSLISTNDKEAQTAGHIFKAEAMAGLGRNDEAIKEYSTGLDMVRSINQIDAAAFAFLERHICYYRKNDLGAAMRDFKSYIQFQPNEDGGYYWQGRALANLGDLDQALANLNRAVDCEDHCDGHDDGTGYVALWGDGQRLSHVLV